MFTKLLSNIIKLLNNQMTNKQKNVCVVVLGDIGRSPRMQYHSQSIAELGHKVDIIGYWGSAPAKSLTSQCLVSFHYLTEFPNIPLLPRLCTYMAKTLWQLINICIVLAVMRKADIVLVQNPPAIPTLFICWVYSYLCGAIFVIDWHNYAHSIMALTSKKDSAIVKLAKWFEFYFGRKADCNFCVTKAMRKDLEVTYRIKATTLYDRPPAIFKPITTTEKAEFLAQFDEVHKQALDKFGHSFSNANKPALIVSSTSWTEDEDFGMLFGVLNDYDSHIKNGNPFKLPALVCAITGKGPLKPFYVSKIAKSRWKNVLVLTPWLIMEDYPKLLASADLGVCLHTSSSGLDLPMKVIDMFGTGLPVCAYDFNCLNELVRHEENSFIFKSGEDLSGLLFNWFENFPNNPKQKELQGKFKEELAHFQKLRWNENWSLIAEPVFK